MYWRESSLLVAVNIHFHINWIQAVSDDDDDDDDNEGDDTVLGETQSEESECDESENEESESEEGDENEFEALPKRPSSTRSGHHASSFIL